MTATLILTTGTATPLVRVARRRRRRRRRRRPARPPLLLLAGGAGSGPRSR
jgi:hypothetical protein